MLHLAGQPHGLGQVAGGHEEDVDVVDLQDVVEVPEGLDLLQHHHDHRLGVGPSRVLGQPPAQGRAPAGEAPVAEGRELGRLDDRPSASARLLTWGTWTPPAPRSRARAMTEWSWLWTRMMGVAPLSSAARTMSSTSSQPGRAVLAVQEDDVEARAAQVELHQAAGEV